jgi:predicted porin
VLGNTGTLASSKFNGKYDGLSFGNAGLALTYGGFTIGGNIIGGRINGALAAVPQHGVGELAYTVGLKYISGPFTIGVVGEIGWSQGNVNLVGISQRRGRGLDFGASYALAPGYTVYAEYFSQDLSTPHSASGWRATPTSPLSRSAMSCSPLLSGR